MLGAIGLEQPPTVHFRVLLAGSWRFPLASQSPAAFLGCMRGHSRTALALWGKMPALAFIAVKPWWAKWKDRSIVVEVFKHLQGVLSWVRAQEMSREKLAFCHIQRKIWNPRREKQSLLTQDAVRQMLFCFGFHFWEPVLYPESISLWQLLQPCGPLNSWLVWCCWSLAVVHC